MEIIQLEVFPVRSNYAETDLLLVNKQSDAVLNL